MGLLGSIKLHSLSTQSLFLKNCKIHNMCQILRVSCVYILIYMEPYVHSVTQLYPTLCNPMDCSLPGSSVREIFQTRILEWVAFPFSRGSSPPRDRTHVYSHLLHCRQILYYLAIRELCGVLFICYLDSHRMPNQGWLSLQRTREDIPLPWAIVRPESANPPLLPSHSPPATLRKDNKEPTSSAPPDVTGLWPWPRGSGRKDLTRTLSIFPPPLGGQWAGKWRTQCRFMRLLIRSQLILVPSIRQLGPVGQHMRFNPFAGVPNLNTSFLP